MLINVLDNAFKFTAGGRVRFAAYEAEGYLIMEVEDSGCGISSGAPICKGEVLQGKNSKSASGIGSPWPMK